MIKILSTFIILSAIFASCKKYDEGPTLSLRSKKTRLENTWKYEQVIINRLPLELDENDQKFRLKFDKEGLAIKQVANPSAPATFVGSWVFFEDKEKLRTTFDYTFFGNPIHEITEYRILKLKNKDLWLEEIKSSGDTCHYHFIPE